MKKLVAASNNKNKIHEMKSILRGSGYYVVSLSDAGIDINPEETSNTFTGNALIKARAAAAHTDLPVFADDSGLSVDCLDGRPGVWSKRFAGPGSDDSDNNAYLINQLKNKECKDFKAHFVCVIAYINENGDEFTFKGSCEGKIIFEARGTNGFGYDPHFFVPSLNKTMAQMSDKEKNSISHRGNALRMLRKYLEGTGRWDS